MINKETGKLYVNDKLIFSPNFTFEDFKKTPYYDNQDGVMEIYMDEKQVIDGREYYVSFFFIDGLIYAVTLVYDGVSISEENEPDRKKFHDEILASYDIISGKEYNWGKVISKYEPRSNMSEILILYNHEL